MDNEFVKGADEIARKLREAVQYIEEDMPVVIGVESVKHFKEGFQNEGFTDKSLSKWASRKTLRAGGTNGQKTLSKSGELADSITYRVEGNTVVVSSDKPYAQIHNEGGTITVTPAMRKFFWRQYYLAKESGESELMEQFKGLALAKTINMPERKFMGESEVLIGKISDKVLRDLTRILNG